jgi:hypothetical protein
MKKILLSLSAILLTCNLQAKDNLVMEMGFNSQILEDTEKIAPENPYETTSTQNNQNINFDFYALLDVGDEEGFYVGPYATVSLTNNGDNPNNYDSVVDYAPYGGGLIIRYEMDDMASAFGDWMFQTKIGYALTKIGDRTAQGYSAGLSVGYEINDNWNIGVSATRYQLSYKKHYENVDANINSVGLFLSYDIF